MLFAFVITPFIVALLLIILQKWLKNHIGWFVLPVPAILFSAYLLRLPLVSRGETVLTKLPWIPLLDLNLSFELSGLSLLFSILITFVGFVVIL